MPQERRVPGQKTTRPRDELGRPLAWEEENLLHMEDFDALTLEENHRLGIEHFDAGRFFPAHEAWETAWKQAKGTPDEEFFKGLSQMGAGYVHYRRGNPHGAGVLLRRAISRVKRFGSRHQGVDLERLVAQIGAHAEAFEAAEREGTGLPDLPTPRLG
jgi:predicted metal-dependent hydrolase